MNPPFNTDDDDFHKNSSNVGDTLPSTNERRPLYHDHSAHQSLTPSSSNTQNVTTTLNVPLTRRRAPGSAHQPPGYIVYSTVSQPGSSSDVQNPSTLSMAGPFSQNTRRVEDDRQIASTSSHAGHEVQQSQSRHHHHQQQQRLSNKEMASAVRPSLDGMSRVRNGWRYRLVVLQHPERARMCGFGDKDRRPLSPSLIVKLLVINDETGEEVSPWEVNTSLFFLAADLCHPDDLILAPRNLLVHQHAASVPLSMLAPPPSHADPLSKSVPTTRNPPLPPSSQYNPPHDHAAYASGNSSSAAGYRPPMHAYGHPADPYSAPASGSSSTALTTVTMEHYTRNLVGAAVTSANVLRDEREEHCIFFVLQDLSVRTEGVYRIRLVFTDLAQQESSTGANEGVSEALAEAYTEPFTVYSPRRFPGMLEPTELSKKLAAQGIKIAVRSDKKKRRRQSNEMGGGGGGGPSGGRSGASGSGGGGGDAGGDGDAGEMDELDDDDDF